MKKNPRETHTGKNKLEKNSYQKLLSSSLQIDNKTEKDFSTESTDSSTIEDKIEDKIKDKKLRQRPKKISKKVKKFFEENILAILSVILIPLLGWLLMNDYNFNANLQVAETNINNLEKKIGEYKANGIISEIDYQKFEMELKEIKNTYTKLEKTNDLEKNYEILKISLEKDIQNIEYKLSKIE